MLGMMILVRTMIVRARFDEHDAARHRKA